MMMSLYGLNLQICRVKSIEARRNQPSILGLLSFLMACCFVCFASYKQ